ncbi:Calsenilin like protein [Argiope bruennichi]|uniref:Calsenilin like protein n=1 Tax=Argiope bruennichi TaxID=94029 RepID=A0A8T0G2Q1_ARGBR|nr:Calsenilin like protein [Argiope bruennichi]
MLTRGPTVDKLKWTFRLYDLNGDGRIDREEIREIISSIYLMLGRHTEPSVEHDTPAQHADKVFEATTPQIRSLKSLYMMCKKRRERDLVHAAFGHGALTTGGSSPGRRTIHLLTVCLVKRTDRFEQFLPLERRQNILKIILLPFVAFIASFQFLLKRFWKGAEQWSPSCFV